MKKIFLSLAALMMMAAPVMTSCSSELEEMAPVEEVKSNIVTITIAPPVAESETRVNIDGSLKITGWEDGVNADVVTLYKVNNTDGNSPESTIEGSGKTFTCVNAAAGTFSGDMGSDDINDYNLAVFGCTVAQETHEGLKTKFIRLVPKTMCSENLKDVVMMAAWKSDNKYTMKVVNNVLKIKNVSGPDKTIAWSGIAASGSGPVFFNPIILWSRAANMPYNDDWRCYMVGYQYGTAFTGWENANPFTIKSGVDSYINMGLCRHEDEKWGLAEENGTIFLPKKAMTGRAGISGKLYNAGTASDKYVDLGLPSGTLWATCNIGADKAEDSGYYFAWGEVSTKETYTWANYQLCNGTANSLKKYCTDSNSGTVDGKTKLEAGDDAATVNWGPDWCMPTLEQMKELINGEYTTQEWITLNEVTGLKITSKTYPDCSIFLPAAGHKAENGTEYAGETAYYWSKSLLESYPTSAKRLVSSLTEGEVVSSVDGINRRLGCPVRAVRKVKPDFLDLGLPSGTLWATCNIGADKPEDYGYYFAWGEVSPKETYTWENYQLCNGTANSLKKYCTDSSSGTVDNKELDPEDDAASVNWSTENCCMPTSEQMKELINEAYTTQEWTSLNGVTGLKITSKKYPDRSIFLPAAGYKGETSNIEEKDNRACYWSKSLVEDPTYFANYLFSDNEDTKVSSLNRRLGYSVRAVKVKLQ